MSGAMSVRVKVEDAWDEIALTFAGETPLSEVKRQALKRTHVGRNPSDYIIKFRGAAMSDESRSLMEAGVVPNSPLIVLARRRRAVR